MRDVTAIEPSWLYELAPHYYEYGTERELAGEKSKTRLIYSFELKQFVPVSVGKVFLQRYSQSCRPHGSRRSTGLPGIIPKISKETAVQNALQTTFCTAAGRTAAL